MSLAHAPPIYENLSIAVENLLSPAQLLMMLIVVAASMRAPYADFNGFWSYNAEAMSRQLADELMESKPPLKCVTWRGKGGDNGSRRRELGC